MSGAQYTITNAMKEYRFDRFSIKCEMACKPGEALHDQVHSHESFQGFDTQNTPWIQKDQIWTLNKSPSEDGDDWILTSARFPQWNLYKDGPDYDDAGIVNENRGGDNIVNRIVPKGEKIFEYGLIQYKLVI